MAGPGLLPCLPTSAPTSMELDRQCGPGLIERLAEISDHVLTTSGRNCRARLANDEHRPVRPTGRSRWWNRFQARACLVQGGSPALLSAAASAQKVLFVRSEETCDQIRGVPAWGKGQSASQLLPELHHF